MVSDAVIRLSACSAFLGILTLASPSTAADAPQPQPEPQQAQAFGISMTLHQWQQIEQALLRSDAISARDASDLNREIAGQMAQAWAAHVAAETAAKPKLPAH